MYCPKCGAEGEGAQNYCRKCGVNLALVGKAVSVGEVIARGDSGLLPRIKGAMGNVKLDEVSAQVARHIDSIGREVERNVHHGRHGIEKAKEDWRKHFRRTPDEQRAHLLGKGFGSFFSGIGLMIVFYFVARRVPFHFPPDVLEKFPFDVYAAIGMAWILGLVPALGGIGQIIGAFMIPKSSRAETTVAPEGTATSPLLDATTADELYADHVAPPSVTEHTTAQLDYDAVPRRERRSTRG